MLEIPNGGLELRKTKRVAEVVGVAVAPLRELSPYDPKDEIRSTLRRGVRGRYRHAGEVDALLAPFTNDALAGVPDRMVANRAGLSVEQVKQWRRRQHIPGRRGRPQPQLGTQFMVSALLGEPTEPIAHEFSPTHGEWCPPAFALRRPLKFDLFANMIAVLVDNFTIDEIAHGFGFEARDVELALALWAARGAA